MIFCLKFGSKLCVLPYYGSDLGNSQLEQGNHLCYLLMDQTLETHILNKGITCITYIMDSAGKISLDFLYSLTHFSA